MNSSRSSSSLEENIEMLNNKEIFEEDEEQGCKYNRKYN